MINDLSKEIYRRNVEKGFYENEKNIGEMLALIHSEISEALECDRKNKIANLELFESKKIKIREIAELSATKWDENEPFKQAFEDFVKDSFEDELADIMIRVMDLAGYKGIDLERHIYLKMQYNKLRPYKHGKKY